MSRTTHRSIRALAAGLALAAVSVFAAPAQAGTTTTLDYQCRFPAIGVEPLRPTIEFNTSPWAFGYHRVLPASQNKLTVSMGGGVPEGLGVLEGLDELSSVTEAEKPGHGSAMRAVFKHAALPDRPVSFPITLTPYLVTLPVPIRSSSRELLPRPRFSSSDRARTPRGSTASC